MKNNYITYINKKCMDNVTDDNKYAEKSMNAVFLKILK